MIDDIDTRISVSAARKKRFRRRFITAPPNFTAVANSSTSVGLSWQPSQGQYVHGYRILRSGTEIANIPSQFSNGTYEDDQVNAETTYTYEIYAYNNFNGQSERSMAVVTTPNL